MSQSQFQSGDIQRQLNQQMTVSLTLLPKQTVLELTCRIDLLIAMTSTGTTDPIRSFVSRGVTITDETVVKLVKMMLKATSPSLKKAA